MFSLAFPLLLALCLLLPAAVEGLQSNTLLTSEDESVDGSRVASRPPVSSGVPQSSPSILPTLVPSSVTVTLAVSPAMMMPVSASPSVSPTAGRGTREEEDGERVTAAGVSTVVGAVVGAVGGVMVVLVLVVLVLLCVVRNKKQRSRDWQPPPPPSSSSSPVEGASKSTEQQQSFANATYGVPNLNGATADEKIAVDIPITMATSARDSKRERSSSCETGVSKASSDTPHEYCLPDEIRGIRMAAETSYEYAYAETESRKPSLPTSRKLTQSHANDGTPLVSEGSMSKPRSYSRREREEIYMAPAKDENSLYAQFNDFKINQVKRESITTIDHLGSGQFGVVQKGMWQSNSSTEVEVALKTLQSDSAEVDKVRFLQEAAIMGQFQHPNVVKLYGVVTVGEPVLIVLELLPKGDLRDLLVNLRTLPGEKPDVHTLLSYCRQIAAGMTYLSGKSFVHRDLAARNILVTEDDICKIADFGMSRDLMDETYYISHGGKIPVKWTAPEALNYRKYSAASDVWSFGVVMYEIWSLGHKPFEGYTNPQTMREVEEGFRLPPPPGCPRAVYELMIKCWHPTTSKRPTFTDVSQHLSLSDPKLLKWAEEDRAVHPEAATLGAPLEYTEQMYPDQQKTYSNDSENNS